MTRATRIADLEAARALLAKAAKRMIDGNAGADAMNHIVLTRSILAAVINGLKLRKK